MTLRHVTVAAAIMIAATTAAACAEPVVAVPDSLIIPAGGVGKLTASTKGMTISVAGSSCFGVRPSSYDIVRAVVTAHSETERASKIAITLHAQKVGECSFVIQNGRDFATVRVRVVR